MSTPYKINECALCTIKFDLLFATENHIKTTLLLLAYCFIISKVLIKIKLSKVNVRWKKMNQLNCFN